MAPSPLTLLVLKQAALALGAIPLYGVAKVYFRGVLPSLFALLYLISPLTLSVDWNNFDPEAFLPFFALAALFFFAKGRLWPFVACWLLALGTIEAAPAVLILFAVGGLIGTFLARPSSPYWTVSVERRALLIALFLACGWLILSFIALQLAGPRGGAFGGAYDTRFTVLGASSLPDVLPRALTHPGAAGAALQFQGSRKLLFLELAILASGALSLVGGLRYLLPFMGYLTLAFLSNNLSMYDFGAEYSALFTAFLFVAAVEGAVLVRDLLSGPNPADRFNKLKVRLATELQDLRQWLSEVPADWPGLDSALFRLQVASASMENNKLGPAELHLQRLRRKLGSTFPRTSGFQAPALRHLADPKGNRSIDPGPSRSRFDLARTSAKLAGYAPIIILVACILPVTAVANPLLSSPVGGGLDVGIRAAGP